MGDAMKKLFILLAAGGSMALSGTVFHPNDDITPDPFASPHALKGGRIRFNGSRPPKSYNAYTDNNTYTHMTFALMYETLLGSDAITTEFSSGLADWWEVSDDCRSFTFHIDERAKWSDGKPVLAEDVKWTVETVLDPASDAGPYVSVFSKYDPPEIVDERTIRFHLKDGQPDDWRALMNVGFFEVMPKHAFEGKKFAALDLVDAVVSGPYRLAHVDEHKRAVFERRSDWWRASFPCMKGVYNFDRIEMKYYEDNENAFEAFKKNEIDVYPVYTAHIMATGTRGKPFAHHWIVKRTVQNKCPIGFQGFAMNMRREPFKDVRVRQALALLLDRDTINRTMMFSSYFLLSSYYTDLYDSAHPNGNTLWPFDPKRAKALLEEAGWKKDEKTGKLMKDGKAFHIRFLSRAASEEKFLAKYKPELEELGISLEIVRKDFAEWMRTMDAFDFDMTWAAYVGTVFRNPEMMWGSAEGDRKGGGNVCGVKDEEIDRMIASEKTMFSAAERNEVYRRIDERLAATVPYILLWNTDKTRLLYWNRFGMPEAPLGMYGREEAAVSYWWYDPDADRELGESMAKGSFLPAVGDVDWDESLVTRALESRGDAAPGEEVK